MKLATWKAINIMLYIYYFPFPSTLVVAIGHDDSTINIVFPLLLLFFCNYCIQVCCYDVISTLQPSKQWPLWINCWSKSYSKLLLYCILVCQMTKQTLTVKTSNSCTTAHFIFSLPAIHLQRLH